LLLLCIHVYQLGLVEPPGEDDPEYVDFVFHNEQCGSYNAVS
jgi:hypothetical protein